ncbi:hypothetical protein G6F57_009323 [Rhizopus arrhizus]|nr:hypothetical protein G6F30_011123 [Rhizopus arrhizus]KAG1032653.1 hypothetical protein G6F25_011120 [Rhizopus arrhizus]KAG1091425.1 hypothetical protein G6F39_009951 [Rhizopus arrhizus]KAG1340199.1 hypothetical protein G6F63_008225 [Rhizopus arrhizus]KAG1394580.1 hypothetical protein G6F60_010767 [Rhizopus arrhizus]
MSEELKNTIQAANEAELISYLKFKKTVLERSNSSSSDSSISLPEIKRKKQLIIDDLNITNFLQRFRRRNINLAESSNNLNSIGILSLSYIFPVDKFDNNRCTTEYIKNIKTPLYSLGYTNNNINKASNDAIIYCKSLVDAMDDNMDIESIVFSPTNKVDKCIKSMCLGLLLRRAHAKDNTEATFTDKYLMPYINEVLLNNCDEGIVYSMIDGVEGNKKKPDFMLGIKNRKRTMFFFFVEVKRPDITSNHQEENDYVKLLKQLKSSIDEQLKIKMKAPVAYGLLCEEEGIYLPVTIRRLTLPKEKHEFLNIPRVAETLAVIAEEMVRLQTRYNERNRKSAPDEIKFMKPSFVTKITK